MSRDLRSLFDPASVAIVGASDDRAKWGYSVALQALRAGDRRPVHLVNRRGGTILGRAAATSLTAIGEPLDLVVRLGSGGVVRGRPSTRRWRSAPAPSSASPRASRNSARTARPGKPRSFPGYAPPAPSWSARTASAWSTTPRRSTCRRTAFTDGSVALLSQSGNLALELELRFTAHGLGFSRFVSFGNQADVSLVDLIDDCAAHERTSAIAVYAEDFADGRGFAVAAAVAPWPITASRWCC